MRRLIVFGLVVLSGCFESKPCTVEVLDFGTRLICGEDSVTTDERIPPDAQCVANDGVISCDNGSEIVIETAPDAEGNVESADMGQLEAEGCQVNATTVECLNGAQASSEGLVIEECYSSTEPGLGERIVCVQDTGESVLLVPEPGSVAGVVPSCVLAGGEALVVCTEGTVFEAEQLEGCSVEQIMLSRASNGDVEAMCGAALVVLPAQRRCRDVVIDSNDALQAFNEGTCAAIHGNLTIANITSSSLMSAFFVASVSGTLTIENTQLTELQLDTWYLGDLVIRNNSKLTEISIKRRPLLFTVEGSVEVTQNKRLERLDFSELFSVGNTWVVSANEALRFYDLPRMFSGAEMKVFMCIDNESLPRCAAQVAWEWGELHAESAYIGNNGDEDCY